MNRIILIVVTWFLQSLCFGQNQFLKTSNMDLAFSVAQEQFQLSASLNKFHGIGKSNKLKLGYGLRYNLFSSKNKQYVTAPAELTSGKTGPAVFFTENILENFDSFSVSQAHFHSFNAIIHIRYDFNEKLNVGFNIGAFGFSIGKEVTGTLISDKAVVGDQLVYTAKPTLANVLLISDNDIGSLNSELYASYGLRNNISIRFGLSFIFTEYTTTQEVSYNFNNDRFRHKTLMPMLAISWNPFL